MHSNIRSVQACLVRAVAVTSSLLPARQTVIAYLEDLCIARVTSVGEYLMTVHCRP